jgi:hypothetical protein
LCDATFPGKSPNLRVGNDVDGVKTVLAILTEPIDPP